MPVTVTQVVARVVGRVRGKLAATGLSAVPNATNPDLIDAVQKGMTWVNVATADPMAVTDADLVNLTYAQALKLVDGATLEALYLCLGACNFVDERAGSDDQEMLSQLEAGIQKMIGMLEDRLRKPYGPTVPAMSVGKTGQADTPLPNDPFNLWDSLSDIRDWPYTSNP